MATVRIVPIEEAKVLAKPRSVGMRRQRMNAFDELSTALLINPDQGAIYEDIDEDPQKFVLSLRGAFRRAGVQATVRKLRGRNEVRAWLKPSESKYETKPEVEMKPESRKNRRAAPSANGRTPELAGVR